MSPVACARGAGLVFGSICRGLRVQGFQHVAGQSMLD